MFKWVFGIIFIALVVVATSPALMAWGKKAKEYLLEMFK